MPPLAATSARCTTAKTSHPTSGRSILMLSICLNSLLLQVSLPKHYSAFYIISHTCHIPRPRLHLESINHEVGCYFVVLKPKYQPQHPHSIFLPQWDKTSHALVQNNRKLQFPVFNLMVLESKWMTIYFEQNDSKHSQNLTCCYFLHVSNLDLLPPFPNICILLHFQSTQGYKLYLSTVCLRGMNVYLVLSEFISTPISLLATNKLNHGSPNFFWERATPVHVGWFAGRKWKNHNKQYNYLA